MGLWFNRFFLCRFFLLFGIEAALEFLDIFGRRQVFRCNTAVEQGLTDTAVVPNVLRCDRFLTPQIFRLDIEIRDLASKVLCLDRDRWKKVRQRTTGV